MIAKKRKTLLESMDLIIFEDIIFITVLCLFTSFLTSSLLLI